MTYYLILIALLLIAFCVKKLLDLNEMILLLRKKETVRSEKNLLEKKYQFIKGLY